MPGVFGLGCLVFVLATSPGYAQTAKFLRKFTDWSAYVHDSPDKKICFVLAQPKEKKPKTVKRDPVFFYVSHWPADKVRNEVNVKIGYPFRKGSTATIRIGKARFRLFTRNEDAWMESPTEEKRLIKAMRKGKLMTVQGRSKRGTRTTDRYSLSGVSAALDRIDQECP